MDPLPLIRRATAEAQAELDRLYAASTPAGGPLDQAGLRDGSAIVEDYLCHGEAGVALEHLLYMVQEPRLDLSAGARADIAEAARILGVRVRPLDSAD